MEVGKYDWIEATFSHALWFNIMAMTSGASPNMVWDGILKPTHNDAYISETGILEMHWNNTKEKLSWIQVCEFW